MLFIWLVPKRSSLRFQVEANISKEDIITLEGVITEVLPATTYRVHLKEFDRVVLATMSGRMRKNNIRLVLGDAVNIEFSPYDLDRGRIARRL